MKIIRSPLLLLGTLCMLASAGCVDVDLDDGMDTAATTPFEFRDDIEDVQASACPLDRLIAWASDDSCPSLEAWAGISLLERGSPWLVENPSTISQPSGRLCLYKKLPPFSSEVAAASMTAALANGRLQEVGSDCEGLLAQQTSMLADEVAPMLREVFLEQIGWVDPATLPQESSPEVVVAVIDTMPFDAPTNPRSHHGETMVRIIEDIACPAAGDCSVQVERVLGLPRRTDGSLDYSRGGFAGSQGDLAGAIIEAVERWKAADYQPSPHPRLVLNFSVGWIGDYFGSDPMLGAGSPMDPNVRAVKRALEYASCHGALIVAAAGNDQGLCTTGPLYPAAWEGRPGPTQARCAALGVTASFDPNAPYRPLVHAVGGLDVDPSEAMPGSREDATPRLSATATFAVAGNNGLTSGHTGTSVSTAVVSGIAAVVWAQDPGRDPEEVMQLLHEYGEDLGFDADVQLMSPSSPVPPQPARRVSLCHALEGSGTPIGSCTWSTAADLEAAVLQIEALGGETIIPEFTVTETCDADCSGDRTAMGDQAGVCEATLIEPTASYVSPQPNDPACPSCTLRGDEVRASLHDFYDGKTISQVMVTIFDGTTKKVYDFGDVALTSDTVTVLQLDEEPPLVKEAWISVEFVEFESAVENELIVS